MDQPVGVPRGRRSNGLPRIIGKLDYFLVKDPLRIWSFHRDTIVATSGADPSPRPSAPVNVTLNVANGISMKPVVILYAAKISAGITLFGDLRAGK